MKRLSILLLCFISTIFSSCVLNIGPDAHILIRNNGKCSCEYISEIQIERKNGNGTRTLWTGTLKKGNSEYLSFEPGEYSIKAIVINPCYWNCHTFDCPNCPCEGKGNYKTTVTTPYKRFDKNDYVVYEYDGAGLEKEY